MHGCMKICDCPLGIKIKIGIAKIYTQLNLPQENGPYCWL